MVGVRRAGWVVGGGGDVQLTAVHGDARRDRYRPSSGGAEELTEFRLRAGSPGSGSGSGFGSSSLPPHVVARTSEFVLDTGLNAARNLPRSTTMDSC